MKNFTLLLISGLLYSGLSYAQTDQIYTRPNEKTAKAPEKKISQFMKPVNKTTRNNDNSIWRPKTEVCFACDPEDESDEYPIGFMLFYTLDNLLIIIIFYKCSASFFPFFCFY